MLVIQGEFIPPALGMFTQPLPIVGPGSLGIGESHLRVSATKLSMQGLSSLLGLIGFIAGTAFSTSFDLGDTWWVILVVSTLLLGAAIGLALGRSRSRQPLELEIPWTSVRSANAFNGRVRIVVARFRPKGMIHFRPASGRPIEEIADAIRHRIGRSAA
jgi:hypothetical protein